MHLIKVFRNLTSRSSRRISAKGKAYSTQDLRKHRRFFNKKRTGELSSSLRLTQNLLNYSTYKSKLSKYSSEISFFEKDFQNKI